MGSLPPTWETLTEFQLTVLAWASLGCCGYLGSKPAQWRILSSLSYHLPPRKEQRRKKYKFFQSPRMVMTGVGAQICLLCHCGFKAQGQLLQPVLPQPGSFSLLPQSLDAYTCTCVDVKGMRTSQRFVPRGWPNSRNSVRNSCVVLPSCGKCWDSKAPASSAAYCYIENNHQRAVFPTLFSPARFPPPTLCRLLLLLFLNKFLCWDIFHILSPSRT